MPKPNAQQQWETFKKEELAALKPLLTTWGYTLDPVQVHIGGERYLMAGAQDVNAGDLKLVLTGSKGKQPIIIKTSSTLKGREEIRTEKNIRDTLQTLNFAYNTLYAPQELLFKDTRDRTVLITEYITEETPLLKRDTKEQFFLAKQAFEMQEGVHATTSTHTKKIRDVLDIVDSDHYLSCAHAFQQEITKQEPALTILTKEALAFLAEHKEILEQYCGFLTHSDFVPHNLRIKNEKVYLLDFASIHFGNKYESWARFTNYMVLYNQELAEVLVTYVQQNRTEEETIAFKAMRIYKLLFLLKYLVTAITKTTGDLETLTQTRIIFWSDVLANVLADKPTPQETIDAFKTKRDSLRSQEEKLRQRELNQL